MLCKNQDRWVSGGSDLGQEKLKTGAAASVVPTYYQGFQERRRGRTGTGMQPSAYTWWATPGSPTSPSNHLTWTTTDQLNTSAVNLSFQQCVKLKKTPAGPTQSLNRQTEEVADISEGSSGLLLTAVPVWYTTALNMVFNLYHSSVSLEGVCGPVSLVFVEINLISSYFLRLASN